MKKAPLVATCALLVAALLLTLPLLTSAQNREKFIISARAGGVNAVTGRATVRGRAGEWQQLMITEDLERGDVVKTGHDGRVEILLNPGSFMRVAENSEFELSDNSLENLEVRLIRGTAIMEVTGADDTELLINITTPHTRMAIVRRGLYRVNVVPGDTTELIVRKGRVMLEGSHTKVKGGNKVVFNSRAAFTVAKLNKADKRSVDSFDSWSIGRAATVAQANQRIKGRDVSLMLASLNDPWSRGFSSRSGGMWAYNRAFGCYTFIPFYSGWGSPYGGSYSSAFYGGYYCCGHRLDPPSGSFGGSPSTPGGSSSGGVRIPPPPRSPGEIPAAAQGKIERLNDRVPNP